MSFDESSEARFAAFVEALTGAIGHADRATPLRHYCTGLLMPAARKSVEPMAAMTAPARAAAQHQSLLHFVGQAPWSDAAVLRCATWSCLRSSAPGPSRPGSSTIPASPRRAGTRWGWRVSIAASSALRRLREAFQRSPRAVLQV